MCICVDCSNDVPHNTEQPEEHDDTDADDADSEEGDESDTDTNDSDYPCVEFIDDDDLITFQEESEELDFDEYDFIC